MLTYKTFDYWNEEIWNRARSVYEEAFGRHSAKSTAVIRNMFAKQMISLHIVNDETDTIRMLSVWLLRVRLVHLIPYL